VQKSVAVKIARSFSSYGTPFRKNYSGRDFCFDMNIEFIEALEEMAKEKGIAREDLHEAIRKGLAVAYQEEYHTEVPVEV